MKQIGLAFHTYNDTNGLLPAVTSSRSAPRYGDYEGGILITLLPFIEQEALFQAAMTRRFETWEAAVGSLKVLSTPVSTYQCPWDPTIISGYAVSHGVGGWAASRLGQPTTVRHRKGRRFVRRLALHDRHDPGRHLEHHRVWRTIRHGRRFRRRGQLWAYPGIDYQWQWPPVIANTPPLARPPMIGRRTDPRRPPRKSGWLKVLTSAR